MKSVLQTGSPRPGLMRGAARPTIMLVMLLASLAAWAQQPRVYRDGRSWVEESSGTLPQARALRVGSDVGSIRVQGGAPAFKWVVKKRSYAGSEAEARKQFDRFRVTSGNKAGAASLDARWVNGRSPRFSTEIYVEVPRDLDLVSLDTMAGDLNVVGTKGRVEMVTKGGSVTVDDTGAVRAQTLGGNVNVGSVNGDVFVRSGGGRIAIGNVQNVQVSTMGGDIAIASLGSGTVQTGGGSIDVRQCRGDVKLETIGGSVDVGEALGKAVLQSGGGNIRIGRAKGRVTASTAGGNIEMWKLAQGAQAATGAGSITAEFLRGAQLESSLRTTAGDVIVYLSGGIPLTVHAASELASGRGIRSEFPELKITSEGGEFGPRTMYADGAINGGGPILKVRTTIGQIDIRKAK